MTSLAEGIAVGRKNQALLNSFIKSQDSLRKISIYDYIKNIKNNTYV
jgi:hypothetical protein